MQEGSTGIITLKEDNEAYVQAMIEFLYTSSYVNAEGKLDEEECCCNDHNAHSFNDTTCIMWALRLSVGMYVLADKYDITSLRQHTRSRLEYLFENKASCLKWEQEMSVLEHAYQHSRHGDELREFIIKYIVKKTERFSGDEEGITSANNFYDIIRNMPDVSEALIKYLTRPEDD